MNNLLTKSWWMLAWRGAAAVLFGVLALMLPGLTLVALVALFAAFALIGGVASAVAAIRHRRTDHGWWLALVFGIVSVLAAVLAVMMPTLTLLIFVLLMGINALVTGVVDIVLAIRLRRTLEREWILALTGVVSILFGALVLVVPMAGAIALVWFVSLYALLTGALLLILARRLRSHVRTHEPIQERFAEI